MSDQERTRGGCLTALLILMMIANPVAGLMYLLGGAMIRRQMPSMPAWAIPVLGVLCLVNLVFAVAVWKWKRWGVYALAAMAFLALVINLSIGVSPAKALPGLVGIVILIVLVRPVWGSME